MKTIKVKPMIQAVSLALALGASVPAFAINGVLFDQDGTGAAPNTVNAAQFDWGVGNVFAQNSLIGTGAANNSVPGLATILAQAHLAQFIPATPVLAGREFTYQMSVQATPSLVGDKLSWVDGGGVSFFRMYTSGVGAGAVHNEISGLGYDAAGGGTLILSGSVKLVSMSITQDPTIAITTLDANGVGTNSQPGVNSVSGNGSGTFEIDVDFALTNYFLTDISSITVDMNLTGSNSAPFNTGEPSDNVVGVNLTTGAASLNAAYGSDMTGGSRVNNYDCGTVLGAPRVCGFHMQGDTSSVVFHAFAPEPGSLALLGLGLGLLGWRGRKLSRQA